MATKSKKADPGVCPLPVCPAPALELRINAVEARMRQRDIRVDQDLMALKAADSDRDMLNNATLAGIHALLQEINAKVGEMFTRMHKEMNFRWGENEPDQGDGG